MDRQVHAEGQGYQVVRYDRAGKWWVEGVDGSRRQVRLDQAVREAVHITQGGRRGLYLRVGGGGAFDRRMRVHLRAEQV